MSPDSKDLVPAASELLLYAAPDGAVKVRVLFKEETAWLTQKALAQLFGVKVPAINKHLNNIFESGELIRSATVSKMEIVQSEGGREVAREVEFYNLDAIIAVGYRVNSYQATQFRIWATKTLRELMIKGFVLDDERLKLGKTAFGKDYFNELLERESAGEGALRDHALAGQRAEGTGHAVPAASLAAFRPEVQRGTAGSARPHPVPTRPPGGLHLSTEARR